MRFELLRSALAGCLLVAGAGSAVAAEYTATGRVDFVTVGDGQAIGPDRIFFAGALDGTYLPSLTDAGPLQYATIICPSYLVIGGNAGGYCIPNDEDGDAIFLTWDCPRPEALVTGALTACSGDTRWIGGTGKFLGVIGGGSLRLYLTELSPDGTARGYAIRNEAYVLPDR